MEDIVHELIIGGESLFHGSAWMVWNTICQRSLTIVSVKAYTDKVVVIAK